MSTFRINDGVVVDYTADGWAEFRKWLDGTYASLLYAWVDEGLAYNILATDGPFYRTCSINKLDAADFEANFKTSTPKPLVPRTADGTPLSALDAPREIDKKPVMVMSPATEGTFTWLSSRGDDLSPTPPASGRGNGTQALLVWDGSPGEGLTKEVELQYCEPVELHDGHVSWSSEFDFEDAWSISVRMPATVATENVGGTGNCNLVDLGGYYLIVPAAGNGTHDIDYDQAVPIPADGPGYWDIDERWSENVTPNAGGTGRYNFLTISIEMFFCKNMDCGDAMRRWDLDAYKAEWISKKWKLCFQATRAAAEVAGKIGGYLMIFRPGAM